MSHQDGRSRQVSDAGVDDPGAHILHVDMDAFYVNVELLDRPELRGRPVIIGHDTGRSVVSSASYEARRFGVSSAMPVARALSLCPSAVVIPPRHERYAEESARVMRVFGQFTPLVEPLSIDEAFLDVAGARRLWGTPGTIARRVKTAVESETGLPCSVGAAGTKFVAKLASGLAKPSGVLLVPVDETLALLRPLPIRRLWGVGQRTAEQLESRAIRTVGDVAAAPVEVLSRIVGPAAAQKLSELARGIDPRPIQLSREEKSIGHETTFASDVADPAVVRRTVLGLADRVAARLRSAGLSAGGVAVKLRYGDFRTVSRSRVLVEPSDVAQRIADVARGLVDECWDSSQPVRLLGVRAERLDGAGSTMQLWNPDESWRDTESTMDELRSRFGASAISRASLLRPRSAE
ncbi:DNA polymerase IV [Mycetocola reblochoni]|uniref:DNA polymerase IV n=1 Tax=Mycetocola reblochoni TaxID=331618 RepID=A0A3L6ZQ45_9MICO|nr:DNA polymerase IV [Mycetocola reblochoni]RLP69967.1 DNA polymerase IV [Mycetocola reblochoni]